VLLSSICHSLKGVCDGPGAAARLLAQLAPALEPDRARALVALGAAVTVAPEPPKALPRSAAAALFGRVASGEAPAAAAPSGTFPPLAPPPPPAGGGLSGAEADAELEAAGADAAAAATLADAARAETVALRPDAALCEPLLLQAMAGALDVAISSSASSKAAKAEPRWATYEPLSRRLSVRFTIDRVCSACCTLTPPLCSRSLFQSFFVFCLSF
jgi:hypothetical protein